jgi:hypothetical protein
VQAQKLTQVLVEVAQLLMDTLSFSPNVILIATGPVHGSGREQ